MKSAAAAAAKSLQSCPTLDSLRPHRRQPTRLHRPWDSPGKNTGVGCHFLLQCMKEKSESEVAQSCPILRDPMDCSLPGSSVHGTLQARVLEWGAIAFSYFSINELLRKQWTHMNWKQGNEAYSNESEYTEPSNMDDLSLPTETVSPLPRKLAIPLPEYWMMAS